MNNQNKEIHVPRVFEVTKTLSKEERFAKQEWERKRKLFLIDRNKFGYGSPESKAAWKARIRKTRSF